MKSSKTKKYHFYCGKNVNLNTLAFWDTLIDFLSRETHRLRTTALMLTNVTKVASWRAVEQLIEEVPVSLRHFISDSFTRHRTILVTIIDFKLIFLQFSFCYFRSVFYANRKIWWFFVTIKLFQIRWLFLGF